MSDLLERLRDPNRKLGIVPSNIRLEAADEIERLRRNIDAMNCNRDHVYPLTLADHTKTIAELRERIAELESALLKIADGYWMGDKTPASIAKKALKGGG